MAVETEYSFDMKKFLEQTNVHPVHHADVIKVVKLCLKQVNIEKSKRAAEGKWLVRKLIEHYGDSIRKYPKQKHVCKRLDNFMAGN